MPETVCIQEITIEPLQAPLVMPFGISRGAHTELDNLLVRVALSNGMQGMGEAAIATHITGETIEGTRQGLCRAAEMLHGKDASSILELSTLLHAALPGNMAAVAAVETALFDAQAKRRGVPLWRMFGDACARIVTDITVVVGSPQEAQERAAEYARQGFKTLKIKIGRDKSLDVERVVRVARAAPGATLYLDANQAFTVREMVELVRTLQAKAVRPVLIEQPVVKEDIEGLHEVWKKTGIAVCADESASDLAGVQRLLKDKLVPAVNIKLMKFGVVQARIAADLAHGQGVDLMIGQMMEGSVATLAAAHLAAGLGYFRYVDLDTPFFIRGQQEGPGCIPYLSQDGVYRLSGTIPGLGAKEGLK